MGVGTEVRHDSASSGKGYAVRQAIPAVPLSLSGPVGCREGSLGLPIGGKSPVFSRGALSSFAALLLLVLGLTAAPASADTASQINSLPILDALNRTENPLSNGVKWWALNWATNSSGHATGQDTTSGWGPYDAFVSGSNGAYWTPSIFTDASGSAAVITMQANPGMAERYISLWLDMSSPGSAKSGYELRWTLNSNLTTYTVRLSKWSSGTQTMLASNPEVVISNSTTVAISDTGGTVTAWKGSGGTLTAILSAGDSSYASGYAGIEAAGNISRSLNFKAGNLSAAGGPPPDTTISSGPKGVVVPNMSFGFTSTEPGSSFECALDGAAFGGCSSPKAYQGLAEGARTFKVRAVGAGGKDETPAERGFHVVQTAKATTKTALLDNLERSEVPLATGKWSKSAWAGEIGGAWMGAYRGYGANSGLAGAYWNPTIFSDGEGTALVAGTVGTGSVPTGQYLALHLNMPNPASVRTGYEARFTGTGSATNYTVELAKWVSGVRSVLASTAGFSLPVGTTMALTQTAGGSLALWTGTSTMTPLLTASDSTFTSGYAGLEVNGGAGTIYNFRAGRIDIQAPNTIIISGPNGIVSPESVSFGFVASESGSSFECSLDGGAYAPCASPKAYPGLAHGPHTFRVRAVDAVGNQDETLAERSFQVLQPPVVATEPAAGIGPGGATLKAIVNPKGGETTYQFEYGTTAAYGSKVPATVKSVGSGTTAVEVSEAIGALASGTTFHFRISATNGAGTSKGEDRTFTTVGTPIATTDAATDVSADEATLNATINPKGGETTYQFEYGPTTSYGSKAPATPQSAGSGYSATPVTAAISGLAENSTYHVRVVATNSEGTAYGPDVTFKTLVLPEVQTEAGEGVDANAAIVEGTVDPNGTTTSYQVEYGTTTAYGQESALGYEELDAPNEQAQIVEPLGQLKPETTYHYRLVARSAAGTDYGVDKTVTTGPAEMSAEEEAIHEEEKILYTGRRVPPPPGAEFAGLHQHGEHLLAQAKKSSINAVQYSGAGWLRVMMQGSIPKDTLETIYARATNKHIKLLPYVPTQATPTAEQREVSVHYIEDVVGKYGPNGTFWNKKETEAGVPINNPTPPIWWEIGNEPNLGLDEKVEPKVFGAAFKEMSDAATKTANVKILLGGLFSAHETINGAGCEVEGSCVMSVRQFMNEMPAHGAYDALSLHPYALTVNGKAPHEGNINRVMNALENKVIVARRALNHHGGTGKQIWITEFGWPTDYGTAEQEDKVPPVTLSVQRELIERAYSLFRAVRFQYDIERAFYFNLQEYLDPSKDAPPVHWAYGTGLRYRNGQNKPGWVGFARANNGAPGWPGSSKVKRPLTREGMPRYADVQVPIDTDGTDASYYFEYRQKPNGQWKTGGHGTAEGEEGDQIVGGRLTELASDTEYEYRGVATNDQKVTTVGAELQDLKTEPMNPTTATFTHLNGEPGWASVHGWSKYDGVGVPGGTVRLVFHRVSDGTINTEDVSLNNGQFRLDNYSLGRGTWSAWATRLPQAGYPESSTEIHSFTIRNGYRLVAKHSQKCLDVYQGMTGEGAPLIQYGCEPQLPLNQVFKLVPMDNQARYQIVARHSNRCVGVPAGTQVVHQLSQTNCLGSAHQIWQGQTVQPNGDNNTYNRFVVQHSGQCMDVFNSSGDNGAIVGQYPCNEAQGNQLWTFQSVDAGQVPTQTYLTNEPNNTYHGMPGMVSFHGHLTAGDRAYPLAGRKVHVLFDRANAQGTFDGNPDSSVAVDVDASGYYSYMYWGLWEGNWRAWAVFYGTGDALGQSVSGLQPITINKGYRLKFRSTKKCLATQNNGTVNGTHMVQKTCNTGSDPYDGQVFSLWPAAPIGANHWQLRPNTVSNPPDNAKCVDVHAAQQENHAEINLYQCVGGANQTWDFPELPYPNLEWFGARAQHSGKCMDVPGGNEAEGLQIRQFECLWNGNQQFAWIIVP